MPMEIRETILQYLKTKHNTASALYVTLAIICKLFFTRWSL